MKTGRTRRDAIRSLKRYLAAHIESELGTDWDIRTDSEQGVAERPVAIIEPFKQISVVQKRRWQVNITQPVTIYLYPKADPAIQDAQDIAYQAEAVVLAAFNQGGHGGRPMRVPMVDFTGIDAMEPGGTADGAMAARNPTSSVNKDPDDEALYTVIVTVTLDWLAPGEVREYDNIVKEVKPPLVTPTLVGEVDGVIDPH